MLSDDMLRFVSVYDARFADALIIQPGWFTISANKRGAESNPLGECIGMRIVVENRDKSYGHR